MIGHDFPYLDTKDLNLDWLLKNMKQIIQDWATYQAEMNQSFSDLSDAFDALKSWVETYFDELDVQQEINNKIDEMIESGELAEILQPIISSEVADWLADHITNPSSPPVDTSLSVSGAAADAKVVGDRFTADEGDIQGVAKSAGIFIKNTFAAVEAEMIPILTSNYNVWLKSDGGGEAHSGYAIHRYEVTPGDKLYIDVGESESPTTFVYKNSNSADNTNNVSPLYTIDEMVGTVVPAGASYLFVSGQSSEGGGFYVYKSTGIMETGVDNLLYGRLEQGGYTSIESYSGAVKSVSRLRLRTTIDGLPEGYVMITLKNNSLKYRPLVFNSSGTLTYQTAGFITTPINLAIPAGGSLRLAIGKSDDSDISPSDGLGVNVVYSDVNPLDGFVSGCVWAWIAGDKLCMSATGDTRFLYKGVVQTAFDNSIINTVLEVSSAISMDTISHIIYDGSLRRVETLHDTADTIYIGYIYGNWIYTNSKFIIPNKMPMFDIKQRTDVPTYINFRRLGYKVAPSLQNGNDSNFAFFGTSERITNAYGASNFPYVWDDNGIHQIVPARSQNTSSLSGKKILTIGDSITKRGWYQKFIADASGAEFVGTQTSNYYDMKCEGYSGMDTSYVFGENGPFWNPVSEEPDFSYYVLNTEVTPNVVVMLFGLNESGTPAQYIAAMQQMIDSIHEYNSAMPVYVVIPFGEAYDAWYGSGAMYYARFKLMEQLQCACYALEDCTLIPAYYVIDDSTDYTKHSVQYGVGSLSFDVINDGVHPDETTGFKKLANIIYNYLE